MTVPGADDNPPPESVGSAVGPPLFNERMKTSMTRLTMIPLMIGLGIALAGPPAFAQERHGEHGNNTRGEKRQATAKNRDIDKLYELVRQARVELQALRAQAGIRDESGGEHAEGRREARREHGETRREGRGEHDERRGEPGERGGAHRERRGEHGERRGESGRGEESGKRLGKNEIWNATRNGARLVLGYNAASQSFKGTVQNTASRTLSDVRVEVHLSNGVELGPTTRTHLKPGAKMPVELSAANQKFTWWTTHAEHGSEEGHGPEYEGGERGEDGEGVENRPEDPALRPLYNELQLLRHEIKMLSRDLRDRQP